MNKYTQEINKIIAEVEQDIPIGSYWRHSKGDVYMVLGTAFHTEDNEPVVLYMRVAADDFTPAEECVIFARPVDMWLENGQFTLVEKVMSWSDMLEANKYE